MAHDRDGRLTDVLLDLARTLVGGYDVADILDRLCDHTVDLLPVAGGGVMLYQRGADDADASGLLTVAASDPRVHAIERLQLEVGEGPCIEAWRTGAQVVATDIVASEDRWPRFAPAAAAAGMKSVYSFPLCYGDQRIGALNLFGDERGVFGEDDAKVAQLLADLATIYVINARTLDDQVTLSAQLQQALDTRVVIEQAKGKIAGQRGIDVDGAFRQMRAFARRRGLRLHEVARGVVDGRYEVVDALGEAAE